MKFDNDFMVWADSFKEGEWVIKFLLDNKYFTLKKEEFRYNFQPVYYLRTKDNKIIRFVIYGGYSAWKNKPKPVEDFLEISRPDVIIFNAKTDKIILAIEETAAVPTGNQSLQRLERVWWAAELKIPFVYLITEYGIHKDGGIRKNSIWAAYFGIKLSSQYKTPSLTLLFGNSEHPEDYQYGKGITYLAQLTNLYILKELNINVNKELETLMNNIIKDMADFILSQKIRICKNLPGSNIISDTGFINYIVGGFSNG